MKFYLDTLYLKKAFGILLNFLFISVFFFLLLMIHAFFFQRTAESIDFSLVLGVGLVILFIYSIYVIVEVIFNGRIASLMIKALLCGLLIAVLIGFILAAWVGTGMLELVNVSAIMIFFIIGALLPFSHQFFIGLVLNKLKKS